MSLNHHHFPRKTSELFRYWVVEKVSSQAVINGLKLSLDVKLERCFNIPLLCKDLLLRVNGLCNNSFIKINEQINKSGQRRAFNHEQSIRYTRLQIIFISNG